MSENIVDFLIIGAGAAGAAAAYNLADTGTSILCLEQGDWNKQSSYLQIIWIGSITMKSQCQSVQI